MLLVFYIHFILSASSSASYNVVRNGSNVDPNSNEIGGVIKSKGTKLPKNLVIYSDCDDDEENESISKIIGMGAKPVMKSTKRSKKDGNVQSKSISPSTTFFPTESFVPQSSKSSKKSVKDAITILHNNGLFQKENLEIGQDHHQATLNTAKTMINTCMEQCTYRKGKSGRKFAKGKSGANDKIGAKGKSGANDNIGMKDKIGGKGKSGAQSGKGKGNIGAKGLESRKSKGKGKGSSGIKSSKKAKGPSREKNACCQGGVSYLKFSFEGSVPGILSTDYIENDCSEWMNFNSNYFMGSSHEPRFVDCDGLCLSSFNCTTEMTSKTALASSGEELCLASWDTILQELALEYKFPDFFSLFFKPSLQTNDDTYHLNIDTTCSSPIYPPHFEVFENVCETTENNSSNFMNYIMSVNNTHETPSLTFIDGISPEFFTAMPTDHSGSFIPTFAECGCHCESEPKLSCELDCETFVRKNCLQEGENGYASCSIGDNRRLITSGAIAPMSPHDDEHIRLLPVDEQILYHENMAKILELKLSEIKS